MNKMGKWLLIFGIVAIAGIALFAVSVAAFGVKDNNYGISIGGSDAFNMGGINMNNFFPGNAGIHFREDSTNIDFDFEADKEFEKVFHADELKDVKIALASCQASISCVESNSVLVKYRTGNGKMNFSAVMENGTLEITEKPGSWFNIGSFRNSSLIIAMPKKLYESVKLELASGSISSTDLTADSLKAEAASGSMNLNVFAEDIDLNIASGKMTLTNCTDKSAAASLDIGVASGSVVLNGFGADSTKINIASGSVKVDGISGKVKADIASGRVELNYAEWNDGLEIDIMSGKADITLPEGSGAAVNYERASGSISIALDGETVSLSKGGNATIGGGNVQSVNAHAMSGSISIHN